jgi:hypothetical protein
MSSSALSAKIVRINYFSALGLVVVGRVLFFVVY